MPDAHETLTDPALPPGALATLDNGIRSGAAGGGRGALSLARRLGGLTSVLVLAVVAVLGFIGGVEVQKRQRVTSSVAATAPGATGGAGLGAAAAARAAAGGGATTTAAPAPTAGAETAPTTAGAGAAAGRQRVGAGAPAGGTAPGPAATGAAASGQVKSVDGVNMYVTDAQGNVVKVVTTPSSRFTRTGSIQDVRPGDTVIVQGQKGEDGVVTATAVNSGTAGGS